VVLVDQAAEDLSSPYGGVDGDDCGRVMVGWALVEALVWSVGIEVLFVFGQYGTGVAFVVDQHPVGAFGPCAADESFGVAVGLRRPGWGLGHVDAFGGERRVERVR
jgi:hypothetical protein